MSRWFRVYGELIDDPKFIKLVPDLRSALLTVWCIASVNDGRLPSLEDTAIKFRLNEQRTQKLLDELERCGFIDRDPDGTSRPHNWEGRQFKSDTSNDRVKRYRERQCNVTGAVTVTPPEQSRTDTEQKELRPKRTKHAYSEEFEKQFWEPYPKTPNMSKQEAWREWQKLDDTDRPLACKAIEPYRRFLQSKPDLETIHACRFLSKRRFEGFNQVIAPPAFDVRKHLI